MELQIRRVEEYGNTGIDLIYFGYFLVNIISKL